MVCAVAVVPPFSEELPRHVVFRDEGEFYNPKKPGPTASYRIYRRHVCPVRVLLTKLCLGPLNATLFLALRFVTEVR